MFNSVFKSLKPNYAIIEKHLDLIEAQVNWLFSLLCNTGFNDSKEVLANKGNIFSSVSVS